MLRHLETITGCGAVLRKGRSRGRVTYRLTVHREMARADGQWRETRLIVAGRIDAEAELLWDLVHMGRAIVLELEDGRFFECLVKDVGGKVVATGLGLHAARWRRKAAPHRVADAS